MRWRELGDRATLAENAIRKLERIKARTKLQREV
jgi:hypothetical protein